MYIVILLNSEHQLNFQNFQVCKKVFKGGGVKGEAYLCKKISYRNIKYSYSLSKCLRNLFPGLLERAKCQTAYLFSTTNYGGGRFEDNSSDNVSSAEMNQ